MTEEDESLSISQWMILDSLEKYANWVTNLVGGVSNSVDALKNTIFATLEDNRRAMKAIILASAENQKALDSMRHDIKALLKWLERWFAESHILFPPPPSLHDLITQ